MTTFVQFYEFNQDFLYLRNSFSSVWKAIDNILWVDLNGELPEVSGEVYVSCSFEHEIDFLMRWMIHSPDTKFIVGGPAIIYMNFTTSLPNFYPDDKQMYEVLGVKPTPDLWGLVPPQVTLSYRTCYYYNYSLAFGNKCYWGKCSFCRTENKKELILDVRNIPILKADRSMIWLNKQAIAPRDIFNLFPTFTPLAFYNFYMRGDSGTLNALKKVPILPRIKPVIGVEFPSDRMLKLMNKGTTLDILTNNILMFLRNGCRVALTVIHGWPNLVESDVDDVKRFLSKLEPYKNQIACINHWLLMHDKEENMFTCQTKYGKKYYIYNLSEEQKALNNKVLDLYSSFGFGGYSDNFVTKLGGIIE